MFSKANLGVRHILPIFPFLIVYASRSINLLDLKKIIPALLFILLILWYLYSSISAYPNYLAYLEELENRPSRITATTGAIEERVAA